MKAINELGSLPKKEALTLLEWVPKAVADERSREACGCTGQELITTAVETPQEFTSDEGCHTTYKDINVDHKRIFETEFAARIKGPLVRDDPKTTSGQS